MITLFAAGPMFGLRDASPFCDQGGRADWSAKRNGRRNPGRIQKLHFESLVQPAVHFVSHGTSSRLSTVPRIGDITSR
jgi:hypothetical protein